MKYANPGFSKYIWNNDAFAPLLDGYGIKKIYSLESGIKAYEIYTDSALKSSYIAIAPYARYVNINGQLIANSPVSRVFFDYGPCPAQPWNNIFSHYTGGSTNEHVTIRESWGNHNSFNTTYYEGGLGSDTLLYQNFIGSSNIRLNSIGLILIRSDNVDPEYGHTNFHLASGFEKLELLDTSIALEPLSKWLGTYTAGNANAGGSNSRGQSQKGQAINRENNLYVVGNMYDNGVWAEFSQNTIDFQGGVDILVYPRNFEQNKLQYLEGKWFFIEKNYTTSFKNLEYVVFTDTAFQLGADGRLNELPWLSVETKLLFGSNQKNVIKGSANKDIITGMGGGDTLTGGLNSDTFRYTSSRDSLLSDYDKITDFRIDEDTIDWTCSVNQDIITNAGSISSLTSQNIGKLLNSDIFKANGASTFFVTNPLGSRTFVALNDSTPGFNALSDAVVEITGYSGDLSKLSIT